MFRRLVTGSVQAGVEELGDRPAMVVRSVVDRPTRSTLRRGRRDHPGGSRIGPDLRIPLRHGAGVERCRRLRRRGLAARMGAAPPGGRPIAPGVVPVVMVVTGPALSGPALLLGLADLVLMTSDAFAFVSGPAMVEEFTGVAHRDPPARGDGHARPVERAVRHRVGHRGRRHGPRGAPLEPAPGQRRRAGPARPVRRRGPGGAGSGHPSEIIRPGPPAPTTCAGWPPTWPTTGR